MPRSLSPTLPSLQMGNDAETLSNSSDISSKGRQKRGRKEKRGRRERKIHDPRCFKGLPVAVLTNYVHGLGRAERCAPKKHRWYL